MDNIMENFPLPTALLPCLAIPFVELFPDLCLGWWTPPSLNLKQYKKMWFLRVSLQFIAWFPVFEMLLPIHPDSSNYSLLVIGAIACIASRKFFMDKQIKRVEDVGMWNTELPFDKRKALFVIISNSRPVDINKFDDMSARYVTFPTKIAAAIVYGIVNALQSHLEVDDNTKLMVAFATFAVGGVGIGGTRHGNILLDIFFRCMFGAGFVAVLHYIAEVSDIVLIKSMN